MKILFVIDSSFIGPEYIINGAKASNLRVIFLTNIYNQGGDAIKEISQGEFIHCNTESFDELFKIISCYEKEEIAGIITFLDSKLDICAELCDQLGVNGLDKSTIALKSKNYVNLTIPEYVPKSISFNIKQIPYEKLKEMFSSVESSLILKPEYTAGGSGVRLLQSEEDINNIENLIDLDLPEHLRPSDIIVQEAIEGELVSIEGYVFEGEVTYIGSTGRRKINNSESGIIFPYDNKIPGNKLDEAKKIIRCLVERSNYKNGFFHTEFIISQDNIKLIDGNFGRIGGGNLAEVIAASYKIDAELIYRHAIEILVNKRELISREFWKTKEAVSALGIAYGIDSEERVIEIKLKGELKSKHTQAQHRGYKVAKMGDSNFAWVGLLSGEYNDVLNDINKIDIRTESGWKKPIYPKNSL